MDKLSFEFSKGSVGCEMIEIILLLMLLFVPSVCYLIWYEFFSKRFVCHVCEDFSKKMSFLEYRKNGGNHNFCAGKFLNPARLDNSASERDRLREN